jgi:hypothetical protein
MPVQFSTLSHPGPNYLMPLPEHHAWYLADLSCCIAMQEQAVSKLSVSSFSENLFFLVTTCVLAGEVADAAET